MRTRSIQNTGRTIVVGACVSCLSAGVCLAGGKTCVQDGAATTKICLEWSQGGNPVELTDFEVDFTDASNPDITLKSGDLDVGEVTGVGTIDVSANVTGDIVVNGDLDGSVTVGRLKSQGVTAAGRILVGGLMDGDITVKWDTALLTLIRLTGGFGSNGNLIINDLRSNFNANGTIHVGSTETATPLDDVAFDGTILIKDSTSGNYGNLEGTIRVVGCHLSNADLDICICGDNNGTIDIVQTGCARQIDWSCTSRSCP